MPPIIITFDEWMKRVDSILEANYFISSADLPDQCYADWFNDGITPASAARKATWRVRMTTNPLNTKLDDEAEALVRELESKVRFSDEWIEVMRRAEKWTKDNGRPLYYTYDD